MQRSTFFIPLAALLLFAVHLLHAQEGRKTRDASLTSERAIRVSVDGGYGKVLIKRTNGDKAFALTDRTGESPSAFVRYQVMSDKGILRIRLNEEEDEEDDVLTSLRCFVQGKSRSDWQLELTDRIPIELSFSLGAGDATLDLSGLMISRLKLEAGASSVRVVVSEKNTVPLSGITISAGVGSVTTETLGNLNFERLNFEGGLGSYMLDLSGDMRDNAKVSAELGMGSLVIILQKGIGARIHSEESFLSSTNYRHFVRLDDELWETPAFGTAAKKISMNIESGIGSVSIRWKE